MTEILTKEKQYLRLNEQLDKMTIAATNQEVNVNNFNIAGTGTAGKGTISDGRYVTYQKTKGQSTLLKKHGAGGDGQTDVTDNKFALSPHLKEHHITVNKNAGAGGGVGGGETYRATKNALLSPHTNANRLRVTKYTDTSRLPTSNRGTSRSIVPTNASTFTVKYRNSKFVESPSLEVLVKEESSSLRCQKDSANMGSVNSLAISDGEHSQARSNATVGPKKSISTEGLIKFLKSKVVILEEDHERISQEMKTQKELLDRALEHSKMLEQQRDQAILKNNTLNEQIDKNEKQLEEANRRLRERSLELNALQKEFEATKRDLKVLTQNNNNLEKRLFRANEELETTRNTISSMKTKERELKESHRLETEGKEKQIKSLKKQRSDLLNAYKKQLFLIDNLKRQNICLEQAKMISFAEKEFTKILDWDMKC